MTATRVTRAEWGARPPKLVTPLSWTLVDTLFVHYTSMLSDQTGDPKAKMRGIQNYHMDTKGWADFAYNQAFSASGLILEGRKWAVHNAATGVENSHSQAVVFLGGDKEGRDDVTPKGRTALGELIREAIAVKSRHGGRGGKTLAILGHTQAPGQAGSTACPGKELLSYIAMKGWVIEEPIVKYPRRFYLFASWYLGENQFKQYGPHNLAVRPKELPARYSPQMAAYRAALRHFQAQRQLAA